MVIDNCEHSFSELAHNILPQYMDSLRSSMKNPEPMSDFAVKGVGVVTLTHRYNLKSDFSGCYVLIDGDKPIYVGISRKVIERLGQHVLETTHNSATLAYMIASARYPHSMQRNTAMADDQFIEHFNTAQNYLRQLSVAFVEIENPVELYVLEAYCSMELNTCKWNTFETH